MNVSLTLIWFVPLAQFWEKWAELAWQMGKLTELVPPHGSQQKMRTETPYRNGHRGIFNLAKKKSFSAKTWERTGWKPKNLGWTWQCKRTRSRLRIPCWKGSPCRPYPPFTTMTSEAGTTGTSGILTSELLPDFLLKILFILQLKEIICLFSISVKCKTTKKPKERSV